MTLSASFNSDPWVPLGGVQKLDHEIASYSPSGAVQFWVVLPNVSHTVDTIFYISYGNDTITTSQENRPAADAARNPAGRSADWLATAANNQNSPSTFYTIYPENSNSIAPQPLDSPALKPSNSNPSSSSSPPRRCQSARPPRQRSHALARRIPGPQWQPRLCLRR